MTGNEKVGWHHRLNGHKFEQTQGDGKGQESLVCCSSWSHKVLDMTSTEQNNKDIKISASSLETFLCPCL